MYHPIPKALENRRRETLTLASDADTASTGAVKGGRRRNSSLVEKRA
jgi:hypothetical protein